MRCIIRVILSTIAAFRKGVMAMRALKTAVTMTASVLVLTLHVRAQAPQQERLVWAPVPKTPNAWIAPNKPHTKLVDVVAAHKGQASWREPIVRDTLLVADYVQLAPGEKTRRQFQPDNPIWWIVQSGEVRFTIEGVDPVVATNGFLVQVPYRNAYQFETVGAAPALLFEVKVAGSSTMYPADE